MSGIASNGSCAGGEGEQVQLLLGSLRGSSSDSGCHDADLDIDGNELVGRVPHKRGCRGKDLAGATFTLASASGSATLTIAEVNDAVQAGSDFGVTSWGYKITYKGLNVCTVEGADAVRRALDIPKRPDPWILPGSDPGPNADYVIPVPGPVYDDSANAIAGTDNLFQLACGDDAVAKRTLYGLYNSAKAGKAQEDNTAALHMLTATYCDHAYTVRGMEIGWAQGMLRPRPQSEPESKWRGSAVLCIEHPRLLNLGVPTEQLPVALQPTVCRGGSNTDPTKGIYGHCDGSDWASAVREESRTDCKIAIEDSCGVVKSSFDYESFAVSAPAARFAFDGSGSGSAAR